MNQPMGNVPNAIRPPQRGPMPGKNMNMPPPQGHKGILPFPGASPIKRDISFPSKRNAIKRIDVALHPIVS